MVGKNEHIDASGFHFTRQGCGADIRYEFCNLRKQRNTRALFFFKLDLLFCRYSPTPCCVAPCVVKVIWGF